jgi:hypothetical protein
MQRARIEQIMLEMGVESGWSKRGKCLPTPLALDARAVRHHHDRWLERLGSITTSSIQPAYQAARRDLLDLLLVDILWRGIYLGGTRLIHH